MARPLKVIEAEMLKLQEEAEAARAEERDDAIRRIRAEMRRYNISADDLREAVSVVQKDNAATNGRVAASRKGASLATRSSDESPAVRLLEDAGIDFRSKRPSAPSASTESVKKPAAKTARGIKATPVKAAAKAAGKGKSGRATG